MCLAWKQWHRVHQLLKLRYGCWVTHSSATLALIAIYRYLFEDRSFKCSYFGEFTMNSLEVTKGSLRPYLINGQQAAQKINILLLRTISEKTFLQINRSWHIYIYIYEHTHCVKVMFAAIALAISVMLKPKYSIKYHI